MRRIEISPETGFCYGVRRALRILEATVRDQGHATTLGAIVHNQPVLDRLRVEGVSIAGDINEIKSDSVVASAHGISPQLEASIRERGIRIIDTTCPFVRRAQIAARRLHRAGFWVIVYGNADHPEIKGVLGWAEGAGLATVNPKSVGGLTKMPRRLGILSQTTQSPEGFRKFAKALLNRTLGQDSELRIVDTICHDIRRRQAAARELAQRVDLMLVVGGHASANTGHLRELCAAYTTTHLIETAAEIRDSWLQSKESIGIVSGASTATETITEVNDRLKSLA